MAKGHIWSRPASRKKAVRSTKRYAGPKPKKRIPESKKRIPQSKRNIPVKELRAITLSCAELCVAVLAKQKRIENRGWYLPEFLQDKSRGGTWLALHIGSSKYISKPLLRHLEHAWDPEKAMWPWNKMDLTVKGHNIPLPKTSAIVGLIRIARCRKKIRGEQQQNPWALGPVCWEIDRAIPLDRPIKNVNGKLGLWSIDRESSVIPHARKRLYDALRKAKASWGLGCSHVAARRG